MKNIYLYIADVIGKNNSMSLATVTRTSGSTPGKSGNSALFIESGLIAGTIGGGVVEGRVQEIAGEAIRLKQSCFHEFNLNNDISNKQEAICGGTVSVLVDANLQNSVAEYEKMRLSLLEQIPGVLVTMVKRCQENNVLINRYWITEISESVLPEEFEREIKPIVCSVLSKEFRNTYREIELSIPEKEPSSVFYLEPVFPQKKLIIAGAGHIGRALSHLGSLLDFEVTVVDDRAEYANRENLPDADKVIVADIGEALTNIVKDKSTFVVIVTRGHSDDALALRPCIGSDLAYLGMIGSRIKVNQMKKEFIENGWAGEDQWNKIYTPVGLQIKSETVEEIAVSIAAQLVLVRNNK